MTTIDSYAHNDFAFDSADLTVVEYDRGGVTVISVGGEIDMSTTPEFREVLARVSARGLDDVVLDLSDVTFMCSAGAVLLLGAASTLSVHPMVLVATDASVRRPLDLLGVCSPITVCASIFEAVSLVAGAADDLDVVSHAG